MPEKEEHLNLFTEGNQFYKLATTTGRSKLFDKPEDLWEASCEYFEWCVKNPIAHQVYKYKKFKTEYKAMPMSMGGLQLFLGISSLKKYTQHPDFSETIERIKQVIYVHNFTHAAAGLLNGQIIGWTLR